MTTYVSKIQELIAKMFAILPNVSPVNKSSVNAYLDTIYTGVTSISSGVNGCAINEGLQEKFRTYVETEEARLQGNLEAIDYDIDASDTLILITGEGRIERVNFH